MTRFVFANGILLLIFRRNIDIQRRVFSTKMDFWSTPDADENHVLFNRTHFELQRPLLQLIGAEINPHVNNWEKNCAFPGRSLFRQLGKLGVFGVSKPVEYGGLGLDFSYSICISEALGEVRCGAIPMACAVQSDMATPALCAHGSDALKREFLIPTVSGERIACIGVSERDAGSDVAGIKTTATLRDGDLRINGSKCWITNAQQADWICLLVNTLGLDSIPADDPHRNKSLVCVDMNSADKSCVSVGRPIEKLGMRSSDTAEIFFDNVRVPTQNIIGEPGSGFRYQMEQFQNERLAGVALLLRPLKRLLNETAAYAMRRQMFGSTAFERHQTLRYTLAELHVEYEALAALLYRGVAAKVHADLNTVGVNPKANSPYDESVTVLASMAKFKAGRLARKISDECLQIWGGNGYVWDSEVSRAFRDFRLYSIGGGCDEVMLSIVAKHIGKK